MLQRLVLLLVVAVFGVFRQTNGGEAADDPFGDYLPQSVKSPDPFELHAPQGVKWNLKEKDAKSVYIPKDLDDCFAELRRMLSKTDIERMKSGPEDQINRYYCSLSGEHVDFLFRFDEWLDHRWLGAESRLAAWFKVRRIDDGDNMADIIVHSFWRHLNAKPIDLDDQIKDHQVPKNLDDCFAQLEKLLPKEEVARMKSGTEKDMIRYHMGLGTLLGNKWGLWKGSHLSKWFNDKGIYHPDDMSGIVFHSFWRHLNGKPINLDEQVKYYQDYWKKIREKRAAEEKKEDKPAPANSFKPLFDGKTFTGWEGNLKVFRIENGAIVGGSLKANVAHNEYLCTTRRYHNFEVRLKFKLLGENVNGGVQFRSERVPKSNEMIGYQADMADRYWGCLYDERRHKLLTGPTYRGTAEDHPRQWLERLRYPCRGAARAVLGQRAQDRGLHGTGCLDSPGRRIRPANPPGQTERGVVQGHRDSGLPGDWTATSGRARQREYCVRPSERLPVKSKTFQ